MSKHYDSLTRTGYCEACCKPLYVRRDEAWKMTIIECRNARCWRGVVKQVADAEIAKEDGAASERWAQELARLQGGAG